MERGIRCVRSLVLRDEAARLSCVSGFCPSESAVSVQRFDSHLQSSMRIFSDRAESRATRSAARSESVAEKMLRVTAEVRQSHFSVRVRAVLLLQVHQFPLREPFYFIF